MPESNQFKVPPWVCVPLEAKALEKAVEKQSKQGSKAMKKSDWPANADAPYLCFLGLPEAVLMAAMAARSSRGLAQTGVADDKGPCEPEPDPNQTSESNTTPDDVDKLQRKGGGGAARRFFSALCCRCGGRGRR